jgi:hypothetical protein
VLVVVVGRLDAAAARGAMLSSGTMTNVLPPGYQVVSAELGDDPLQAIEHHASLEVMAPPDPRRCRRTTSSSRSRARRSAGSIC